MTRSRCACVLWLIAGLFLAGSVSSETLAQGKRPIDLKQVKKDDKKKLPQPKKLSQVTGFSDWVTSVAYSPDGKLVACGSYELFKIWNTETKRVEATVKVKSGYVKSIGFSPDGQILATGSYQSVGLYNSQTRKPIRKLDEHRGYVTGLSFSPDGTRLATSSEDETVRVWDVNSGAEQLVIRGHAYPVQDVAFSPNGKQLATAAGDPNRVTKAGEVKLWDAVTGEELLTFPEHLRSASSVAFSPDGAFLISTSEDETVNVYDVSTGKALGFFGGHGRPTNSAVFCEDGKIVISGSGGRAKGKNEIIIWDRATGEQFSAVEAHRGRITSVAIAPNGRTLATASYDKTVAFWDLSPVLPGLNVVVAVVAEKPAEVAADEPKPLRVGIIGLDTSHVIAFTKILNDENAAEDVANCRVVAAYPKGSPDIESSTSRVPGYTKQVKSMGVEIVDSISALIEKVDVVLLETNDGRPHFEQVLPVLKAGKPVFIDKPIAGSLADAIAIFAAAKKYGTPLFSSSSLRYTKGAQALRNGKIGDILGCDTYSPCSLEKTHPDLFWYGIHGVESLFTVMGTGCQTVTRSHAADLEVVTGIWKGGRIGTFRGIRKGKSGYGGTAFGTKGIEQIGSYGGYRPLLVRIVEFFRNGKVPVSEAETLEIYAFMEAADESKRQNGKPVSLESVMAKARVQAAKKLGK